MIQTRLQNESTESSISQFDEGKQELGRWAVWSLSSAKPGFGIHQLRDNDYRVLVS